MGQPAPAVFNACRDRLPVTDGWQRRGKHLRQRACYRTLFCVQAAQLATVEFDASWWTGPAHQMQHNNGVCANAVARQKPRHERPNQHVDTARPASQVVQWQLALGHGSMANDRKTPQLDPSGPRSMSVRRASFMLAWSVRTKCAP